MTAALVSRDEWVGARARKQNMSMTTDSFEDRIQYDSPTLDRIDSCGVGPLETGGVRMSVPKPSDGPPRSGMVPFVPQPEQTWSVVRCGYCATHGVESFHDISNCEEDFGDRWGR